MAEYVVIKAHWGDKDGARHRYQKDEVRIAEPHEVEAYIHFGIIEPRQLDHDGDGKPGKPK